MYMKLNVLLLFSIRRLKIQLTFYYIYMAKTYINETRNGKNLLK